MVKKFTFGKKKKAPLSSADPPPILDDLSLLSDDTGHDNFPIPTETVNEVWISKIEDAFTYKELKEAALCKDIRDQIILINKHPKDKRRLFQNAVENLKLKLLDHNIVRCYKCNTWKIRTEFYSDSRYAKGKSPCCKTCRLVKKRKVNMDSASMKQSTSYHKPNVTHTAEMIAVGHHIIKSKQIRNKIRADLVKYSVTIPLSEMVEMYGNSYSFSPENINDHPDINLNLIRLSNGNMSPQFRLKPFDIKDFEAIFLCTLQYTPAKLQYLVHILPVFWNNTIYTPIAKELADTIYNTYLPKGEYTTQSGKIRPGIKPERKLCKNCNNVYDAKDNFMSSSYAVDGYKKSCNSCVHSSKDQKC